MSRPFSRSRSPFPSLVSLSRHAFNNSWLCRTRDSSWIFHVCTAGNAVVAEKSNYSRRRSTSMAHRRPKLPVLGGKRTAKRGNEHGTAMLNKGAIRSASPARWKYILYLNTAATLLRALHFRCDCVYCPNQSYTSGYLDQMEPCNGFNQGATLSIISPDTEKTSRLFLLPYIPCRIKARTRLWTRQFTGVSITAGTI